MLSAIKNRKSWKLSNTEVEICGDTTVVKLFNNTIAKITPTTLSLSDATWRTPTTKSRLNVLRRLYNLPPIYQHNFIWYTGEESNYNSKEEWSGSKQYVLNLNAELECL